jgi:hypothetical protein
MCGAIAYTDAYANCNSATYSNTQRESDTEAQADSTSETVIPPVTSD